MIIEDQLEQQCLQWFREGGWKTVVGPDIAHDSVTQERANYREAFLVKRLTRAMARLKSHIIFRILATLRHKLLPELLSGELLVTSATATAEAGT